MKNNNKKKKTIYNIFNNPFYILILILSSFLFTLNIQFNTSFKTTSFERLLYNTINLEDFNGAISSLSQPFFQGLHYFLIILFFCIFPLLFYFIFKKNLYINFINKKLLIYPISVKVWSFSLLVISVILLMKTLDIPNFILNNISYSDFYENSYVVYDDSKIKFTDKKRNLITIYVESLENSVFSSKNGGVTDVSYMPILEELTSNYTNFSNNDSIGGFHSIKGTDWTASSLIAQTSGIPIYIKTKNDNNKFLEGAVSIGEILSNNGYKNYFLMGSDAEFGERKKYFLEHGNYDITDYIKAKDEGLIESDYYAWWGFEDKKLYSFAKDMLLEISKNNEPFNFSILTADTHFYEGYVDASCPEKFDNNYANSYHCTDIMLSNFINWVQLQNFYDNTTIVIVGDHLTMRDDFFDISKDYERTVYNLFINSVVDTDNTKNRIFSAFDIYPTTLASIGATIEDDRLALGTNLFSEKKTLMEELGYNKFVKEVLKKSKYYNQYILVD